MKFKCPEPNALGYLFQSSSTVIFRMASEDSSKSNASASEDSRDDALHPVCSRLLVPPDRLRPPPTLACPDLACRSILRAVSDVAILTKALRFQLEVQSDPRRKSNVP